MNKETNTPGAGNKIIECVPNFSEGNNPEILNRIAHEIKSVDQVKLINIDPGKATNRTVFTFVGTPEAVCEAAFRAVKTAAELIDMSKHHGEHPRFGATDVLPLIPVRGVTMSETVEYARKLGKRIASELGIPIYFYEFAATEEKRRNLANCRAGEYEGLQQKLADPAWKPDCGPAEFNETVKKTGAIALSARNFLIAYNVNLNTTSTRWANAIASDIREKGHLKRDGHSSTGKIVRDEHGNPVYTPGLLKGVKGIGWYIEEYGIAQLSFNITDIEAVSMHQLFELACERAAVRGIRVTGSELVGVVPLKVLLDAGKYFLRKQHRSTGIPDMEILKIAVKSMGLDELAPFDPKKKIIEYLVEEPQKKTVDLSLEKFTYETASESAAPGGASIAACIGALGAALGTMAANLSANRTGWEERWEEFSGQAEKGKLYYEELLRLVDEGTATLHSITNAFRLPQKNEDERKHRHEVIQKATHLAVAVPFRVMQASYNSMDLMLEMAENGNPHSVSDAGIGALAARSAVLGAALNIRNIASGLDDKDYVSVLFDQVNALEKAAIEKENRILEIVNRKIIQ
ncbi:MAG TPA: glutamate formimidoyltransferase [Paludibacter sp.]|nr:glutamate formimidoyltransferase [Paludibacter sp.]